MAALRAPSPEKQYAPGSHALVSGMYRVIHHEHRAVHGVVVIKGDGFPPCRTCRNRVRYALYEKADYVAHDWDLSGPNLTLIQ